MPLFVGKSRPNSMVARTDVTLATISEAEVEALLAPRPEWWRHIGTLGILSANLATSIAADMMIRDSSRRCAAALLQLADCRHADQPGAQKISAPLSQEELASISDLSRTSISTILHDFETAGLITLSYRSITLNNPVRLRALVDEV